MDADELALFKRFVVAVERLAAVLAPEEKRPQPAILTTATYSEEARARKELREKLYGKQPQPPQGAA